MNSHIETEDGTLMNELKKIKTQVWVNRYLFYNTEIH